jgi:hypothetical protein
MQVLLSFSPLKSKADYKSWCRRQLLTIMSRSIAYLTSRVNFVQVSDEIPVTKQRNPEKVDPPDVFEGSVESPPPSPFSLTLGFTPEPNSKQEGACGRPHDESQTDRISHTIAPHTGTGRSPGTPYPRACMGDLPHGWELIVVDAFLSSSPPSFGWGHTTSKGCAPSDP